MHDCNCDEVKKCLKPLDHLWGPRVEVWPLLQSYGFSSSHVWICDLDHKENWAQKNWYFWTVVLKKTLKSPLDCKAIQPVNPKGNQFLKLIWRTDVEAEAPIL